MRFSLAAIPLLAANLVTAFPAPQELDLDLVAAVPDPTYTEAVGVTAQAVTYDATALAAQATEAVSSVSIDIDNVLSSTAIAGYKAKRTACAPQPTGIAAYAVKNPDTAAAFASNSAFSSKALSAATPNGYTLQFQNLNASSSAYGYMGFTTLKEYDTGACAQKCSATKGCLSFNLYFERDPSVEPGATCTDPASVTMIKCVMWGGEVSTSNTKNFGQYRSFFNVVIAGSNGYTNSSIVVPSGFSNGQSLNKAAINAPYDHQGFNTLMGWTIFTQGGYNASLCAEYCRSQTSYNVGHPAKDGTPPKICNFFNTFLLYVNGTIPQGQYCTLYTERWDPSYATNFGQKRGNDEYTIAMSYAYSNLSSEAPLNTVGDKKGAIYQAALDMKYDIAALESTFLPFCSALQTKSAAAVTSSVTGFQTITQTATATATTLITVNAKRAALSTPNVLSKYPATVVSSACDLIGTFPALSTTATVTVATSTVSITTTAVTTTATVTSTISTAAKPSTYFSLQVEGGELDQQWIGWMEESTLTYLQKRGSESSVFRFANGGLFDVALKTNLFQVTSSASSAVYNLAPEKADPQADSMLSCRDESGYLKCDDVAEFYQRLSNGGLYASRTKFADVASRIKLPALKIVYHDIFTIQVNGGAMDQQYLAVEAEWAGRIKFTNQASEAELFRLNSTSGTPSSIYRRNNLYFEPDEGDFNIQTIYARSSPYNAVLSCTISGLGLYCDTKFYASGQVWVSGNDGNVYLATTSKHEFVDPELDTELPGFLIKYV